MEPKLILSIPLSFSYFSINLWPALAVIFSLILYHWILLQLSPICTSSRWKPLYFQEMVSSTQSSYIRGLPTIATCYFSAPTDIAKPPFRPPATGSQVMTSKRSKVFCSKETIQIALVGSFWLITIQALLWKAVWWSSTATNQSTWSQLISKANHSLAPEDISVANGCFTAFLFSHLSLYISQKDPIYIIRKNLRHFWSITWN